MSQPERHRGRGPWGPLTRSVTINAVLPLALFYILRARGAEQWLALLLSSAVPALRVAWSLAARRRADSIDLFVAGLLAVSAATSLISGSPRVLLLKDVGMSLALGAWIAGSLLARRPFAYHFGIRLGGEAAAAERDHLWQTTPALRRELRKLTAIWGGGQLFDAAVSTITALTLPVDVVPLIGRCQTVVVLGATVLITLRRARRFRARYGMSLLGTRSTTAPPKPQDTPVAPTLTRT
ncbi:VC0807 family protein [Streptomyces rimosus]|uniref:VC0807 family protein n=1 Tax=Streptomyces rimosus TaxID=1927 RepID=UPI0007C517E1|nr:VC0807 family protein [Streptomyces rimosus]